MALNKLVEQLSVWARDLTLNGVLAWPLIPRVARWRMLRLAGVPVERSALCAGLWLGSRRLAVGAGTFINYGCRIDNTAWVRIGRNCDIGPEVGVFTTTHDFGPATRRAGIARNRPVTIGDGVWVGARATILPGVSVGDGAVIASGAVVTRDCEPGGVYAGVPARLVRTLP